MWNGIEDMYMSNTNEKIPSWFFFVLAGSGNFIYQKSNKGEIKRFVSYNDGRTKQMYKRLAPIIGFSYTYIEGRSFGYMLKKAKEKIDEGKPVILGMLDMYYLSYYPKFYMQEHIPIHYVLMVGYDDDKEEIMLQDCGVQEVQTLSYSRLEKALAIPTVDGNKPNTMCYIEFNKDIKAVEEIAREAFMMKAEMALQTKLSFLGIRGMHTFAKEFIHWSQELSEADYKKSLYNLVTFTGTVPILPDALSVAPTGIPHRGTREKIIQVLAWLQDQYGYKRLDEVIACFKKSGEYIERMNDMITLYLLNEESNLKEVADLILKIADCEEEAYRILQVVLVK